MKILNGKYDPILKEIVLLHNITKRYILLGEETDVKFNSYLQPIKEFRDSYDHILRIFKGILFSNKETDELYIQKQLSKALGHEYRAFFDVADWFSIICRSAAMDAIKNKENNFKSIKNEFPEYEKQVDVIINSDQIIAKIREEKDVGGRIEGLVNRYQEMLVQLYDAMTYIRKATKLVENDTNNA